MIILDFYSDTCSPCKIVDKHLEQLKKEIKGLFVERYNVDVDLDDPIMQRYGYTVTSLPTLMICDNEYNVLDTKVGALPYPQLKGWIMRYINEN